MWPKRGRKRECDVKWQPASQLPLGEGFRSWAHILGLRRHSTGRVCFDAWMDARMDDGGTVAGDDDDDARLWKNEALSRRLCLLQLRIQGFAMALSASPCCCFSASVSKEMLSFTRLHLRQDKGLARISCKADDTIGSKRRGRRGGRKDPMMDEKESVWPYLETQRREIADLNKQLLVDTENLLDRANSKFGLVLEIAEEANEYLRHNKDEALTRKPILKVISDRINEAAGENIRDAYCEETLDPQE